MGGSTQRAPSRAQLALWPSSAVAAVPSGGTATHGYPAVPIYRVTLVREGTLPLAPAIQHAAHVAALVRRYLGAVDREHLVVLLLDQKHQVIGLNTVSVGSLTASIAHPREILKPAILANAASFVLAHNHPSGVPTPSAEDRTLTRRLAAAGQLLGMALLDHVIVGDGTADYYSFAEHGELHLPPATP